MLTVKTVIVENHFPRIIAGMETQAGQAVRETVFDIEGRAKLLMQGPKHGAEYPRGKGAVHQASAPGEAPAVDTGHLWNSIQTEMVGRFSGVVFTNAEYAPALEFGSVHVAARPFFTPATQGAWPDFLEKMKRLTG